MYDFDSDGVPNHLDLDSDNDGIPDVIETGGTDANRDGIADGTVGTTIGTTNGVPSTSGTGNTPVNTDGTGNPDYLDIDADDDGIPDNIEGQISAAYVAPSGVAGAMNDTNNNGVDDNYETLGGFAGFGIIPTNTDETDTKDYIDTDSDNDNVTDIRENGDPQFVLSGVDTDGDGLDDAFDDNNDSGISGFTVNDGLGTGVNQKITDTTTLEAAFGDADADFNPGTGDLDFRDVSDIDGDGVADYYDLDDDNDGILDTAENGVNFADGDEDGDGIPNYKDTTDNGNSGDGSTTVYTDSNADGIPDVYDNDSDGVPNHLDLDSDNDGISDVIEAGGIDADRDGKADDDDNNVNNIATNGIPTTSGAGVSSPVNTDGTGKADYLDIDADDDGIPDNIEAQTSIGYIAPSNPTGAMTDANNNGVDDNYEVGGIGLVPPNTDSSNDAIPDYLDSDSDNDGITDISENGDTDYVLAGVDTDGDGLDDNFDDNADAANSRVTVNDGVGTGNKVTDATSLEAAFGDEDSNFNPGAGDLDYRDFKDTDLDGIADFYDIDDDNDGILDELEGCRTITTTVAKAAKIYTMSGSPGIIYSYDTNTNTLTSEKTLATKHNAMAYNTADKYMWTNDRSNNTLAVYDPANSFTKVTGIAATSLPNVISATFNPIEQVYVANSSTTIYVIDGNPTSATYGQLKFSFANSIVAGFNDISFNADNGFIYGVKNGTNNLIRIDIFNKTTTNIGAITNLPAGTYGRSFYLSDGTMYFIRNSTLVMYKIDLSVGLTATVVQTLSLSASSAGRDAATIPSISFTSEKICRDSDGDGIPDSLDLDSDNDGIPDNIEAQSTRDYIAPSGLDTDLDGLDNAYDTTPTTGSTGSIGINPQNTDNEDLPDYLDLDSDGDGIFDIVESGSGLTDTAGGADGKTDGAVGTNGLDNTIDSGDNYTDVNGSFDNTQTDNFTDTDADVLTIGDVDYRDATDDGIPMITQVYQFGTKRWIEITNIHDTKSIAANLIKIQLYQDKTGDQTSVTPDVLYTVTTVLAPGKSILIKNTANTITNIDGTATVIENNTLTAIEGANDIITLSRLTDATSWANRYDVIDNFANNTSYVRIDETLLPNTTYTASEWVVFKNDALDPYRLLGAGGSERHPHDPLISEIESSNAEANTLLGLHRINITTRTGAAWSNGFPDRSRFVVIDEDYNHTSSRLSARKLTVNATKKLSITDNLLVVTNNVLLNGDLRLVNPAMNSAAQLIQTHTSATLVTGAGKLLVDQNSTVPSFYRYNYIGSPVKPTTGATTYTVDEILKDGTIQTNHTGTIGVDIAKNINWVSGFNGDTTDPISLADYWIYTYAASGGTRASYVQQFKNGAIPITDGFIFKGPGRVQNYTFAGIPKDGQLTTSVGANESYLVANPYASSISVKEFIEDNINSISGTLYFWEHASEKLSSPSSSTGHNFGGYLGGYATRTITMGVTAKNAAGGAIDTNFRAENALITGGAIEVVTDNAQNINIVTLDQVGELLTFKNIASGVDTLRIRYKSPVDKIIRIKENNAIRKDVLLPASINDFSIAEIKLCVVIGSNIAFESIDTNLIQIDYLNLKDDGDITCAPNTGGNELTYTEPEAYIAIGQGFFLQGDETGGGIEFNNSQREYKLEGAESVFFKSSKTSDDPESILNIPVIKIGMNFNSTDDGNNYHRQIGVSFSQYNSFNYDKGYDAEIYDIGNTDFYWKFPSDDKKYVIAGVQTISTDLEIPIEISMGYSGTVSIAVDEMKNITGDVYITDKLNSISYEIINGKANLTLDTGTYTNRFVLAFTPGKSLSVENDDIENLYTNIYVDNKQHKLVISKSLEININNVEIYNILGKKINFWKIREQKNSYQLDIKKYIPAGIYIVRMSTNKGVINKKIVIE